MEHTKEEKKRKWNVSSDGVKSRVRLNGMECRGTYGVRRW
jgi:hypothetical protein